jgi:hypothetical protein
MHPYDRYWLTNLLRGFLAILASAGVAYLPTILDSTLSRLLFLPFAIAISLVCLSLYGITDSVLLVTVGCVIRKPRTVHWLVILQGLAALALLSMVTVFSKDGLNLRLFTYFAALQALSSGLGEVLLAIQAKHHDGTAWLLTCASISLIFCAALMLGGDLTSADQARVLLAYLTFRGISLSLLSLKMLYLEESPSHRHGLWNAVAAAFRASKQATT